MIKGLECYLVGGAVRDRLLDVEPRENDWVVVGATPRRMLVAGLIPLRPDFPVYRHPLTGDEYALARRETKIAPGHDGFELSFDPEITLEEDLARRDLTINAIAQDREGRLIDPYGGESDLRNGVLRNITPAFVEDPLRLIRVARFAAVLGRWGFRVAHRTHKLMQHMAESGELATLPAERIWSEFERALHSEQPWRFVEVLHACGALGAVWSELDGQFDFPDAHAHPEWPPCLQDLASATDQTDSPEIRFAALWLSVAESSMHAVSIGSELRAPASYGRVLVDAVVLRETLGPTPEQVGQAMQRLRAWNDAQRWVSAATAWAAQFDDTDQRLRVLSELRDVAARVDPDQFSSLGYTGAALGEAITRARVVAIRERGGIGDWRS